jgi:hypothetical protein
VVALCKTLNVNTGPSAPQAGIRRRPVCQSPTGTDGAPTVCQRRHQLSPVASAGQSSAPSSTSASQWPSPARVRLPRPVSNRSPTVCVKTAVHARTTVTFDGVMTTVHGGDVGVSPGTSITGSYTFDSTGQVVLDSSIFADSVLTAHAEAMAVKSWQTMAIPGADFHAGTYRSDRWRSTLPTALSLDGLDNLTPCFSSKLAAPWLPLRTPLLS